jgi:hypothetical protein
MIDKAHIHTIHQNEYRGKTYNWGVLYAQFNKNNARSYKF